MNKTFFVVKIILQDKNTKKLIFLERSDYKKEEKHTWDLPGGLVDFGEDCRVAIKREVKEEINLKLNSYKIIESYSTKTSIGDQYIFILYYSNDFTGEIKLSKEHLSYKLIDIKEIKNLNLKKSVKVLENEIINYLN